MNRLAFTLIELLIASALFLAAVIMFNYVLKTGASLIAASGRRSQAFYDLQAKMEELGALPFENLAQLNGSSFAENKGKIYIAPVFSDLSSIRIDLKWNPQKPPLQIFALRSCY